jgi:hypothetical protein
MKQIKLHDNILVIAVIIVVAILVNLSSIADRFYTIIGNIILLSLCVFLFVLTLRKK